MGKHCSKPGRMQRYTLTVLRSLSKPNGNFENYHIDRGTRSWIIILRIRKQHKPYRGSRAGQMLLHRIHTLNLQQQQNLGTWGITYQISPPYMSQFYL